MSDELIQKLVAYVDETIIPYLEVPGNEEAYPDKILDDLAAMGLFGATVSAEFGGSALPPSIVPRINEEMARGWQSLIALVGTHFGLCGYFANCGTDEQKSMWLPGLASGSVRAAHAYHERSKSLLEDISTQLHEENGQLLITGYKDWSTNADRAARIMTICRHPRSSGLAAVWVDPAGSGVTVSPDLPRTGLKGVTLNSVSFDRAPVEEGDVIGGLDLDITEFMRSRGRGADIGFAARSLGAGRAILEETQLAYVAEANPTLSRRYVNAHRVTEMEAQLFTIRCVLAAAIADDAAPSAATTASFAKVVASRSAQEMAQLATAVVGGASYAASRQRLHRACRDAVSLTLVDTPNGTLLGAITDART